MTARVEEQKMGVTVKDHDYTVDESSTVVLEITSKLQLSESVNESRSENAGKTADAEKIAALNSMVKNSKEFDLKLFLEKMETIEQVPESLDLAQLK